MRWTALSLVGIFAVAASLEVALGQRAGQKIEIEVRRAQATPFPVEDPDVAAFSLKLDLRLTNRSRGTVFLPKAGAAVGPDNSITLISLEGRQADGAWVSLGHASLYGTPDTKFPPCMSAPPGGSADFADVPVRLVFLKTRLAGLGDEPTVRLSLWFFCKQPDGQTRITDATTGEFKLQPSAQR